MVFQGDGDDDEGDADAKLAAELPEGVRMQYTRQKADKVCLPPFHLSAGAWRINRPLVTMHG